MLANRAIFIGEASTPSDHAMKTETLNQLTRASHSKRARYKKDTTMTTGTPAPTPTQAATMTVFDLTAFDDVKLFLAVPLPPKPTTLEEALAAVGNDTAKLLEVIHEGLSADAIDRAKSNPHSFYIVDDDGKPTSTLYTGKFADEDKGKLIGNAILAIAKMNGYEKSLPREVKASLKEKATQFLRDNPAMLSSIIPATTAPIPVAESQTPATA